MSVHGVDFTFAEQFKCDAAIDLQETMTNAGAFGSEEQGFALEMALQYGFEVLGDDAEVYAVRIDDLYTFMKALGYTRCGRRV